MEDLLIRYGLLAVLLGAALEGDVTMLLAGVLAHLGYIDFPAAVATGCAGALVSDAAFFLAARRGGAWVRETRAYARALPLIEHVVRRIGSWELVLARFVFGTRAASMIFWGLRGLPWPRFVAMDTLGCAAWALVMATLGYTFSGSAAMLLGEVKKVEWWLAIALLVAVATVILAHRLLRRFTSVRGTEIRKP